MVAGIDEELLKAIKQGTASAVQQRLNEMEQQKIDINATDQYGKTILYEVAQISSPEKIKLLLDHGANPKIATSQGSTPLHASTNTLINDSTSHDNAAEIALLLIQKGADVNAQDNNYGNSALHIAVNKGNLAVVKLLLERGANPELPNKRDLTPLALANSNTALSKKNNLAIREALENAIKNFKKDESESEATPTIAPVNRDDESSKTTTEISNDELLTEFKISPEKQLEKPITTTNQQSWFSVATRPAVAGAALLGLTGLVLYRYFSRK